MISDRLRDRWLTTGVLLLPLGLTIFVPRSERPAVRYAVAISLAISVLVFVPVVTFVIIYSERRYGTGPVPDKESVYSGSWVVIMLLEAAARLACIAVVQTGRTIRIPLISRIAERYVAHDPMPVRSALLPRWYAPDRRRRPAEPTPRAPVRARTIDRVVPETTAAPVLGFASPPASGRYDVALSFAGEDRGYVERIARDLKAAGVHVFYDRFEQARLWGAELTATLDEIYRERSRFVVIFISEHYLREPWTRHERTSASARALELLGRPYVLPVRLDDTVVPGISPTIGYLDARGVTPDQLVRLIVTKLRQPA